MKRLLRLLTIAGAVAGAVWYARQQEEATAPAPAEGTWEARPALKSVPDPVDSAEPADDLTAIKGIGPKYAQQLADIGITTFAQLAAADPTSLDAQLDARAAVDDWVAQAKELARG